MFIPFEDVPTVLEFLKRELNEFRYKNEDSKSRYLEEYCDKIDSALASVESGDFIHIDSITNLGLVQRTLTLTPVPWKYGNSYSLSLPPSPRGGISIQPTMRKK